MTSKSKPTTAPELPNPMEAMCLCVIEPLLLLPFELSASTEERLRIAEIVDAKAEEICLRLMELALATQGDRPTPNEVN
ncbi:hypothetical protein [Labrys sp. (in: a-proteobacteria)]|uniref:hypothetical protein n=1 Tax=Labrys sp. (in: a-proteobacteria) TaxID=1917972 RepID=UPI0039E55A9A